MNATEWWNERPRTRAATGFAAVLAVEATAVAAYLSVMPVVVTAPRYLAYPFVWLNAGLLAVWYVDADANPGRRRRIAAYALAAGYFLALAAIEGMVAVTAPDGVALHVYWRLPPGWGPLVAAELGPLHVAPVPYRALGYAALAYLAYAAVLDADATPAGALVGLFSCVSCTLPVLATLLSGVAGGALAFGAAATYAYDLSTLVYLAALALLAWRSGFGGLDWRP